VEEHPSFLKVRSYERGVEDETLSCGTGVTASVLAYAKKASQHEGHVEVSTRGGVLKVSFKKNGEGFTDIWLTGAATQVFKGKFNTELFD
jgi:diaminopimelate epimerase